MSDDTTTGQVPETTTDPDQTAPPAPETHAAQPEAQTPEEEPFDKERALATIRKLREFEKQHGKLERENAEYKRREEEAETARLSKEEQLTRSLAQRDAELEFERTQHRDRQNQYELQLQASKLGVIDPEAAAKLLDWSGLEYDDDGRPTNLAGALTDLLEAKPYLKGAPAAASPRQPQSATNPATRQPATANRIYTAAEIGDRAFWNANKADILLAIKEDRVTE